MKDDLPLPVRPNRLCNYTGVRPCLLPTVRSAQIRQVPQEVNHRYDNLHDMFYGSRRSRLCFLCPDTFRIILAFQKMRQV